MIGIGPVTRGDPGVLASREQATRYPGRTAQPIVLADAQGILWVPGGRRSARALPTGTITSALVVHAETP